jgi:hypothetical protein
MSIILTDLSRASALGNSPKGCSRRPRAHSPTEPKKGGPSDGWSLNTAAIQLSFKKPETPVALGPPNLLATPLIGVRARRLGKA